MAVITTGSNSLSVALSSLISVGSPNLAAGQEVSDIEIILSTVPTSVSLSSSAGTLIDIAPGGAVTPDGGTINHWGAVISGGTIFLATAGTGSIGGKPVDLIIGNAASYPSANPSITGRNPQIQGTGTFVLALTGEPNPTITSVVFSFGTGPDSTLPGTLSSVPLPAALPLFASGLGALGLLGWRRKRKAAAVAAWSKHLIEFRRDRREAVFLIQDIGVSIRSMLSVGPMQRPQLWR
jgi:hypothetical protein